MFIVHVESRIKLLKIAAVKSFWQNILNEIFIHACRLQKLAYI